MVYLELIGPGDAWFDDVSLSGERAGDMGLATPEVTRLTPSDFWDLRGYEIAQRDGRQVLQIPPASAEGTVAEAEVYFEGETARYDVLVSYLDEPDGASTLEVLLNDRPVGATRFDAITEGTADVLKELRIPAVDVQRGSVITLTGRADNGEYCRVVSLSLQRVGRFQGELLAPGTLKPQPSLRVYPPGSERDAARQRLSGYLYGQVLGPADKSREAELAGLDTPQDWAAYQEGIRARLSEYFGPWPERTPLNPRNAGELDRPEFRVEKIIFESRPSYYVTANLYIPKHRELPAPGVVFVCGHAAEGKGYHLYSECCQGMVLKGYVVLAIDPTGQGERSEYFDPLTLKDLVPRTVAQHHQLGRPSFLVGRTLGGYRTWDAIRAVDYLVSRPEVDPERLAAVGNSGGGQMAFLVTAADPRIDVCVAAHPGGSMENTYLNGLGTRDREVLSLIPPRPCRVIVGKDSGETGHEGKVTDMQRFYRGLGYEDSRCELTWVDGVHDMKQPKREPTYGWLNHWFGKEQEGATEPPLEPLTDQDLWCTPSGYVLKDLGGETGQSLNWKAFEAMRPRRDPPGSSEEARKAAAALRERGFTRLGFAPPHEHEAPRARITGTHTGEGFAADMIELRAGGDLPFPALLLRPEKPRAHAPLVVHAAQWGKPQRADRPSLALDLCRAGLTVLSIDVTGTGETDPRDGRRTKSAAGYDPDGFARDSLAISLHGFSGRSLEALRATDVLRAVDYLRSLPPYAGTPVRLVGEELGGLWVLLAAAADPGIEGVATVRTLLSFSSLLQSPYHEVRGHFWLPGAVADFDLCELSTLCAPHPCLWATPVDAMGRPVTEPEWTAATTWPRAVAAALGQELSWAPEAESMADQVAAWLCGPGR